MKSEELKGILKEALEKLGASYDDIEETSLDGGFGFNVVTKNSGMLIGHRGENLSALNHIVKKIASKSDEEVRVSIDVNGYLEAANRALKSKVSILAERAKSFKTSVEMEPMSPFERMMVHSFLAADPHIETKSVGEGKKRRVVIKYKEE